MSACDETGEIARGTPGWLLAALTIFCGAFFLFQVEPLIAKAILPWFGGSAQVWTTCLLFFQAALLAGYLYAHLLSERVRPQWQIRIHVGLLLISLAFLPIFPAARFKPVGGEDPLLLILGLLTATIGLPFMLLSATNPLIQSWLARAHNERGVPIAPYWLFALSNLASMMALLAYPVLVEPNLTLRTQTWSWSIGYAVFAVLCATAAWRYRSLGTTAAAEAQTEGASHSTPPAWADRALWFALAAAPSALLLAVTNFLLQNVAAIPLFWIVPLTLYLLSFIFAFGSLRWYWRTLWYGCVAVAIAAMLLAMSGFISLNDFRVLPLFALALFVCCMVCHGELSSLRPSARYLTSYYLTIAAGGAAGGLFVAVLAPLLFNANYDLQIIVPVTAVVVLVAIGGRERHSPRRVLREAFINLAVIGLCGATTYMAVINYRQGAGALYLGRNFYGSLRVTDLPLATPEMQRRQLLNGTIDHGEQFTFPAKQKEPLTYYSRASGVGLVLDELGKQNPLSVGVIGLGTGTIGTYCRPGDAYRFYDINPMVKSIALNEFYYMRACPRETTIVLGDARLSLESEIPQHFDVLAIDAFISDAIPIHLLTREAFALYWRHLKPDGVLAVHVSNRYVDLEPIVAKAAAESGKIARLIENDSDVAEGISRASWVLVTSRKDLFDRPAFRKATMIDVPLNFRAWTDDYSNLWKVLRIRL